MSILLKYLRDPIWQAVGALLAVVAILITLNVKTDQKAEVAIYPYHKVKFEQFQLPSDRVRLVIQGTKEEINRAVIDYFIIVNRSDKAIVAADFAEPFAVSATNKTERILLVSSCDSSNTAVGELEQASYIQLNWQKKNPNWSASPVLLNSNDRVCIGVISQEAQPTTAGVVSAIERLKWSGRIVNTNLKVYKSADAFDATIERNWIEFLKTEISLSGFAPYWFVVFQMIFFVLTLGLALRSNWLNGSTRLNVVKLCAIVLICTATAEIFTDIFVNLNWFKLHASVGPLLVVHTLLLLYLVKNKKKPPPLLEAKDTAEPSDPKSV